MIDQATFVTLVRSPREIPHARLLIASIRAFGGPLSQRPIWLFEGDPVSAPCRELQGQDVRLIPLDLPGDLRYFFVDKAFACARAEEMLVSEDQSLIWIDPACLVINPPELYALDAAFDAAVRPVHITNVGLPSNAPLDGFWKGVYARIGIPEAGMTVQTFVDGLTIRAYFNSHAFSINPSRGLMRRWYAHFEALVRDETYQKRCCQDQTHRIFLHQAVLSALLASSVPAGRLRLLPPEYNYPYNLHQLVPFNLRAAALNDLVSITYEDRSLDPAIVEDIEIREPLRGWLSAHLTGHPDASRAESG